MNYLFITNRLFGGNPNYWTKKTSSCYGRRVIWLDKNDVTTENDPCILGSITKPRILSGKMLGKIRAIIAEKAGAKYAKDNCLFAIHWGGGLNVRPTAKTLTKRLRKRMKKNDCFTLSYWSGFEQYDRVSVSKLEQKRIRPTDFDGFWNLLMIR